MSNSPYMYAGMSVTQKGGGCGTNGRRKVWWAWDKMEKYREVLKSGGMLQDQHVTGALLKQE